VIHDVSCRPGAAVSKKRLLAPGTRSCRIGLQPHKAGHDAFAAMSPTQ
jgi:hypothetical protein